MSIQFDNLKMPWGMYKGKEIKDVPDTYLKFLLRKQILKGKLLFHCQVRFDLPKTRYQVIVEDAVVGNGTYIIEAYNKQHAINICKSENKVQCTQSYHGTSFQALTL